MKDAFSPAPDGVFEALKGTIGALDVMVRNVVLMLLVGNVAGTVEVVLAHEVTRCKAPFAFGRPPCLQWPALTTTAYARRRRKCMMLL